MQLKQIFIAGLLAVITLASCSKKNDVIKPVVPIEGKWIGKSSVLSDPYNSFYSFNIKPGGVLERLDADGAVTGNGQWAFYNGDVGITATYTLTGGATFSIIGTFDKINGKLDGTWGNGTKEYGGGYWYMNKTN